MISIMAKEISVSHSFFSRLFHRYCLTLITRIDLDLVIEFEIKYLNNGSIRCYH